MVGGVSLPPAWIVKIEGTRTFVAPAVAAAPVVFGGVAVVVTVCEAVVVELAVGVAEELEPVVRAVLVVVLECFEPPHPPIRTSAGRRAKSACRRLICLSIDADNWRREIGGLR